MSMDEFWFGSYEPLDNPLIRLKSELPIAELEKYASSKNVTDRINLTDYPFPLPDHIFFAFLGDEDPTVRAFTASHRSATTQQLERALTLRPEIFDDLVDHPNAPLVAFQHRPIDRTDGPDRRRYLALKRATSQQRAAFLVACSASEFDETITLGSLWHQITTEAPRG